MGQRSNYATITIEDDGSLSFASSYNRALVAQLKAEIPYSDRRWDKPAKVWRVNAKHMETLQDLAIEWLNVTARVEDNGSVGAQGHKIETLILKIEYIGQARERGDGSMTATGYANGDWSVIFPEDVLKDWFDSGFEQPTNNKQRQASTLFAVLGIKQGATPAEIKSAYRKAAKTWHPDLNQDPDAPEQFMRIQAAYETLSDPVKCKRYIAGLRFEKSLQHQAPARHHSGYNTFKGYARAAAYGLGFRPPIRCGYIAVEAASELGRYHVRKILEWKDIKDASGRSMVSYWPKHATSFVTDWV